MDIHLTPSDRTHTLDNTTHWQRPRTADDKYTTASQGSKGGNSMENESKDKRPPASNDKHPLMMIRQHTMGHKHNKTKVKDAIDDLVNAQQTPGIEVANVAAPNYNNMTMKESTQRNPADIKQEISSWFMNNLGLPTTRAADEYTHTAMTMFLLESARDIKFQFRPNQWHIPLHNDPEWTVFRKKKAEHQAVTDPRTMVKKPSPAAKKPSTNTTTPHQPKKDQYLTDSLKEMLHITPLIVNASLHPSIGSNTSPEKLPLQTINSERAPSTNSEKTFNKWTSDPTDTGHPI